MLWRASSPYFHGQRLFFPPHLPVRTYICLFLHQRDATRLRFIFLLLFSVAFICPEFLRCRFTLGRYFGTRLENRNVFSSLPSYYVLFCCDIVFEIYYKTDVTCPDLEGIPSSAVWTFLVFVVFSFSTLCSVLVHIFVRQWDSQENYKTGKTTKCNTTRRKFYAKLLVKWKVLLFLFDLFNPFSSAPKLHFALLKLIYEPK